MSDHTRITDLLRLLGQTYPDARYYLHVDNPLQLLVATILSAQVRDTVVNAVTPALFSTYKTAQEFAEADLEALLQAIRPVSFPAAKARNIKRACQILVEQHGGQVPDTMEALVAFPGIGRKTANAILINGFNKVVGIVVDTHVIRLARRLGLSRRKDPTKIEQDLMAAVPREHWKTVTWWFKDHGQTVCRAPIPLCSRCELASLCPKIGVTRSL